MEPEEQQLPAVGRRWLSRAGAAASRLWETFVDYAVRIVEKADDDNVFLLASGITFSVLVAAIPFLFIIVSLISLTIQAAAEASGVEPMVQLRHYLDSLVPVLGQQGSEISGRNLPEEIITRVLEQGQALGLVSFAAFMWFSTRLFGSLRAVLREIFDLRQSRGIIQGKLFDAEMVVVSSVLIILNLGIPILFNLADMAGLRVRALMPIVGLLERLYAAGAALAFIFILFLLLYKFVPARRVPWRMALIAAAFTAVLWEVLKLAFGFYLTRFANVRSIYGGIATLVVVVIWVYYLSIVFVLGGEVAQVYELRRVRRTQKEVLE